MPTESADATEQIAQHELGILFVHGIGEQPRGQTLVDLAEPIYEWLRGWTTGADAIRGDRRSARTNQDTKHECIADVTLHPVELHPTNSDTSAHATIQFTLTPHPGSVRTQARFKSSVGSKRSGGSGRSSP